jgi:hypothetical protein
MQKNNSEKNEKDKHYFHKTACRFAAVYFQVIAK